MSLKNVGFENIVLGRIGNRGPEIEKKVYKHKSVIRSISKKIDSGQIGTVAEAMEELRKNFSYHLSNEDYRYIEKNLEYKFN